MTALGLVEKIKRYRDLQQCSLNDARKAVEKEQLLQTIDGCLTFYELKQLLRVLAERTL